MNDLFVGQWSEGLYRKATSRSLHCSVSGDPALKRTCSVKFYRNLDQYILLRPTIYRLTRHADKDRKQLKVVTSVCSNLVMLMKENVKGKSLPNATPHASRYTTRYPPYATYLTPEITRHTRRHTTCHTPHDM